MSYRAVILSAVTAACAVAFTVTSALAAGDTDKQLVPAGSIQATPQTASIDPEITKTSPSSPIDGPVNLSLDAFRSAATTPVDSNAGSLAVPPEAPGAITTPKGAVFVPLVKDDEQSLETNNRTSAVQRSEFGVQLRSDF